MRKLLILLIAIPLAGCFEGIGAIKTDAAKCELATMTAGFDPSRSIKGENLMILCMRAAGYELAWEAMPPSCMQSSEVMWLNGACYAPTDPFSKWLWQLELRFRFGELLDCNRVRVAGRPNWEGW